MTNPDDLYLDDLPEGAGKGLLGRMRDRIAQLFAEDEMAQFEKADA